MHLPKVIRIFKQVWKAVTWFRSTKQGYKVRAIEGTSISRAEWESFIQGPIWAGFLFELQNREKFLVDMFIEGDTYWSPEVIRAKINELGFLKQVPDSLIAAIENAAHNANKENEDG